MSTLLIYYKKKPAVGWAKRSVPTTDGLAQ